jgi:ferrous iron transport protein A
MRTILFKEAFMSDLQPTTSLLALKKGHRGRIASIEGGKLMVRRMLSLGLRVGTVVNMLNHRGKSVVIQNKGTRVALGPDIADKLLVEPLKD